MAYQHVLAAIDLSDEARQVLERARRIADEHKAKLSVCTVVKPLTHVYGGLDMMAYTQASVSFEEQAVEQARIQVETEATKVKVKADNVHVSIGAPASQVVETARALGADLIVTGSHGKHGLGLLLGSTANGILHQSTCDVLTVRIRSEEAP
ncbi:MAG: universal stress protein [Pseudomonadales bacterium]